MRPLKIFKGDIGPIPRSSPVYSLVRTILQQIAHSAAHGPDSVGKFFLRLNKFCRGGVSQGETFRVNVQHPCVLFVPTTRISPSSGPAVDRYQPNRHSHDGSTGFEQTGPN